MDRRCFLAATGATLAATAGCVAGRDSGGQQSSETLTLATGTSTYDSGILGPLNDDFESRFDASVDAIARGTGAALRTARNGDADVVLTHAPTLEAEFVRDGYGVNRRDLMYNDFVIVGPDDDPAGIGTHESVTAVFAAIAETESTFVSRGDRSGTHLKELEIWEAAGIDPSGSWYREAGSGQGEVLTHADFVGDAYALTDRGTYLSMRSNLDLRINVEGPLGGGPERLLNPYRVMAVNENVHPHVAYELAMAYIGFLTSLRGQALIGEFTVEGIQLFYTGAEDDVPYVPDNWQISAGDRE